MCSDFALSVDNLGKAYELYARPFDRLKQTLFRGRRQFYREFWALRNFNMQVKHGETVAVIGRNGSGKSTLLQLLVGTLSPTVGQMTVNGKVSALLELGAGFNPEFTGRDNVWLSAALYGLSRYEIKQQFDSILSFADIGEFIDQPVKTYSSGMYVRLAFAVAVCVRPDILIVDEALSVGDIFFQQKCVRFMKEQLGYATKILVTHDMHTVANTADRVYVLENGTCTFAGPPKEAIEHYTKQMHTEAFASQRRRDTEVISYKEARADPTISWTTIEDKNKAGRREIDLIAVAVTDRQGTLKESVQMGDEVCFHLHLRCRNSTSNLIFGYIVNDRVGNAIFGENSLTSGQGVLSADCRDYHCEFAIVWPEIRPDEYTVTVGIGEGSDALHHDIQVWGHNVLRLTSTAPGKIVHCLFNRKIDELRMRPLGDDPARCSS